MPARGKPAERVRSGRRAAAPAERGIAAPTDALAEARNQLAATSEILRVISQSRTDVQPVFDTIAASALKLCSASSANVFTYDGSLVHLAALVNLTPEGADAIRSLWPRPPSRELAAGRAILTQRVIEIPDVIEDADFVPTATTAVTGNFRSILAVPLMREGTPIGAIAVGRPEAGRFPETQIALLLTFAEQAVIAIENVRLFNELESRNHDLTEALEQQTATSEILRVISRSPTDVHPVFDTIVRSVLSLCDAAHSGVYLLDGDTLSLAATAGLGAEARAAFEQGYPRKIGRDTVSGQAALECRVVQTHDLLNDPAYSMAPGSWVGARSVLAVPLMRDGKAIGSIGVWRAEVKPFSDSQITLLETFADQAVIAIENVRLFTELEARNRDLTEALEQQTATSEILRAISHSPTDTKPVFDAIVRSASQLCDGHHTVLVRVVGSELHLAAVYNAKPRTVTSASFPRPVGRDLAVGRAILDGAIVHIPDALADPEYPSDLARELDIGSILSVPLLRDGKPIGAIGVSRASSGAFPDNRIELLKTFAEQAVIAIENVRLFTELEARNRDLTETLERQTATSEILRVISQSPTDVQPVFDTIAKASMDLCRAESVNVFTFDGKLVHLAAFVNVDPAYVEAMRSFYPRPLGRDTAVLRAIQSRSVVVIPDVLDDSDYVPVIGNRATAGRFRSILAVPLMRERNAIGGIAVGRPEPGAFPASQIALLQTFADQAVIAIENVRLFTELEARNRDLTEALEQQTVTSEILQVISRSPTDLQPVLDAVVESAARLCGAYDAVLRRVDGGGLRRVAHFGPLPEPAGSDIHPIDSGSVGSRAFLERRTIHVDDVVEEFRKGNYLDGRVLQEPIGYRTMLAAPLVRKDAAIGVILIRRMEVRPFSDKQIALLQTFADQAAIAIENARLFNELEARTRELTRSVGELKALGEVGQAVSSTLNLEIVLATIVSRATELAGLDGGSIWEYDEAREEFQLHATNRLPDELVDVLRATPIRKGQGVLGRLAVTGEPVEIPDIAAERSYPSRLREVIVRCGYRSVLAVPLLREDQLLGALAVNRSGPGGFGAEVIELMKTFATQSALAIQNARLFREIEQKSRELEAASRHKSEFLANMSHELRTPLNAIIGFSEVLAEQMFGTINEKQADYLSDILESGRHLLSLINDILDLSKIEAGRMELEPSEFDLPGAVENALILVRERAGRHGIALVHEVDDRLGTVRADERKVKQVLLNLLSNALKFTPEGGRVAVRARVHDGVAEISVADTGVGIAPEDQAAVFEEFRQVGTASRKIEGTGLGLAISRKFIELHGGRIWVTSEPGVGSTFAFTLPLSVPRN